MTKNTIYVQDNGFVLVTPKNESTLVLTTKQVCDACKKQIPKKVTHEASIFECCTCPNCKNVVDEFTDFNSQKVRVTYSHCKFCGQALDWSDTKHP